MTPLQAIVKNLILLVLLGLAQSSNHDFGLPKRVLVWAISISLLNLPFFFDLPDHWRSTTLASEAPLGLEALNGFLLNSITPLEPQPPRKLIAFYGAKCKYCKQAAKRISEIVRKHQIDHASVLNVFWGKSESINDFYAETSTTPFTFQLMDTRTFFSITNGQMPIVVLVDRNHVLHYYQLASLNEHEIVAFLRGE